MYPIYVLDFSFAGIMKKCVSSFVQSFTNGLHYIGHSESRTT